MSVTTRVLVVVAIVGGLALGASGVALASLQHFAATAPSQTPAAQTSPTVHPSAKGDEAAEAKASPEPSETPEAKASPEPSETPEAKASPEPSETPEAKASPEPSETPEAKASPEPSETPEASPSGQSEED